MTRAILQRVPEYIPDIDYPTLCAWQNAGLIYPVAKNEQGLEVYSIDDISKRRGEIESKYEAIVERRNMEERVRSLAKELETTQAKAKATGSNVEMLRFQKLQREQRELSAKLKPVVKVDTASLQTELEDVRQQRDKAQARAKQTAYRDDIFEYQRLDRRAKELEKQIRSAQ